MVVKKRSTRWGIMSFGDGCYVGMQQEFPTADDFAREWNSYHYDGADVTAEDVAPIWIAWRIWPGLTDDLDKGFTPVAAGSRGATPAWAIGADVYTARFAKRAL